ncbi:hypothetical protein [Sphingomonas turrisvirgatae]|nr:hypothetical protein [Sphingomonas turrisvirgatae]
MMRDRASGAANDSPTFYIITWIRLFFGAHLLFSGGRYILTGYVPEIPGIGGEWASANAALGLYQAVKYMEFVFGIMLLTNRFVLLALILEMPATVNIFYLNTVIVQTPRQLFTGPQELFLNGVLLLAYSGYLAAAIKPRLDPLWLWHSNRALKDGYAETIRSEGTK